MKHRRAALGAALIGMVLGCNACQVAGERGFRLLDNTTDFSEGEILDDILVWPVQERGTGLHPNLLERMTRQLHGGMRDQKYSVLSRSLVDHLSEQLGGDDGAAVKALEKTDADGVLIVRFTKWDERGLLNLGWIRAEGQLKLLGPDGRVHWQARLRCDDRLVPRVGGPRDLDERRAYAAERIVQLLAARLPAHRV